jgi:predicted MFS family arabinose efflux permease
MASLVDITIALLVWGFAEFVGALVSSRASRQWQILKIVLDLDC